MKPNQLRPHDRSNREAWIQSLLIPDNESPGVHFVLFVRHDNHSLSQDAINADLHRSDLSLVRSALTGDSLSTEKLGERLSCVPAMVRAQHRRMGQPLGDEDLNEVIQDTLITIWSKLDSFEGRARLETWAFAFSRNQLMKGLDRIRRGPRREEWDESEMEARVEREALSPEAYRAIHDKIAVVGPPGSDIILCKHFEQLTFEQIGERLAMPTNTVKTRYYRSLERLRVLLAPFWKEVEA